MMEHYPRTRETKFDKRVGESKLMKCGLSAIITEYYDRHDITVRLSNGKTVYKRTYTAFCQGSIDPGRVAKRFID